MNKKKESIEEKEEKDKDDAQWSIKRIAIFLAILALIIFGLIFFFQARSGEILGEQHVISENPGPQIKAPSKDDIGYILKDAEKSIENIDINDIVSSQPQIQNAIDQLEKLTSKDNFKETFCSTVCAE